MAIGNLVDIGNKIKITAWAVSFHPISKTFDLLVHPAKLGIGSLHVQHAEKTCASKKGFSNAQELPTDINVCDGTSILTCQHFEEWWSHAHSVPKASTAASWMPTLEVVEPPV